MKTYALLSVLLSAVALLGTGAEALAPRRSAASAREGFVKRLRVEALPSSTAFLPIRQQAVCKSKPSLDEAPLLLRPWIRMYNSVPKIKLPLTDIDIGFTFASAAALALVDYGSAFLLAALGGWPEKSKHTRAAAGSIATIVHSTLLVFGVGAALASQRYDPSGRMDTHPDWWQDGATALIQLCTGYMLYDASVQFIADRWQAGVGPVLSAVDKMFLGHHAATAFYMMSARLIGAGHMSAMILMFTGEFTAPIMNVNRLARIAATELGELSDSCCGKWWLQMVRPYADYSFALLYALFRIVIGPVCAAHLTYDILLTKRGRENVPVGLSLVWLIMCWGVLIGSIPWIKNVLSIISAGFGATAGGIDP